MLRSVYRCLHAGAPAFLSGMALVLVALMLGVAVPAAFPTEQGLAIAAEGVAQASPTATATPTPVAQSFIPVIVQHNLYNPTRTSTPTATPTPLPPCALPSTIDASIVITVTPNQSSPLEQLVGRVPFTVQFVTSVSGGTAPYSFCWDVEPDGHRDAQAPNPIIALTRPGIYHPFLVVTDAEGMGQYVGSPP